MKDSFGREIDYMRISITDRCNLRCRYCMPEDIRLVPMKDVLTYEEITEIVRAAVPLGITKFRVTGGEPLVRRGAVNLIREINSVPGVTRTALTTNGILLGPQAKELANAGLKSVNVSLDTCDAEHFKKITGADRLEDVKEGIRAALAQGLQVKINCVPQGGEFRDDWRGVLELARQLPVSVRFIEMMPVGYGRNFETISNETLLGKLMQEFPQMAPDTESHGDGPAVYWKLPGFAGSVGMISAIHGKFCDQCNRVRLTAQGKLKLCLCYADSVDLREILRNAPESERQKKLQDAIREGILRKPKEHHFERAGGVTDTSPMAQIGG